MQRFRINTDGRLLYLVVGLLGMGAAAWMWGMFGLAPRILTASILVLWILGYLARYRGRVVITSESISAFSGLRLRPRVLRWESVRHLRLLPQRPDSAGFVRERILLQDDAGRVVRIPRWIEGYNRLRPAVEQYACPVIRRKLLSEWEETWKVEFRCPGRRWGGHAIMLVLALLAGTLGVATYLWFRARLGFQTAYEMLGAGAFALFILILLLRARGRGAWIGATAVLSLSGIRIRRVDLDREISWRSVSSVEMGVKNEIIFRADKSALRIPSSVNDRELLVDLAREATKGDRPP